jgi:hypothetical protein
MKTSTGTTNDMFKAHFHFATFPAFGENFFRLLMGWRGIFKSIHINLSCKQTMHLAQAIKQAGRNKIYIYYRWQNAHASNPNLKAAQFEDK